MSGHRGRPGGFEAIKYGASREDARTARHLEQSLESFYAEAYESKVQLDQYIIREFNAQNSVGYSYRRLEDKSRLSRWIKAMKAENCPLDVVLMAVVNGVSFSHLDKKMQRRKGWSREQLILALRIFRALL